MQQRLYSHILGVTALCYLPVALLLLFSGFAKLLAPEVFRLGILLLPYDFSAFLDTIVYGVPVVEIGLGLLLFWSRFRFIVLFSTAAVLCFFTFVMLYAHTDGALVTCACFGYLHDMPLSAFLIRNFLLVLLCVAAIFGDYHSREVQNG
jgi:hypothetical protein